MSPILAAVISCIIAFFIGGIPFGVIFGRFLCNGLDIRSHGSGNMGFTNAARVGGKKIGVLTLIGDVLKGVIAVSIGAALIRSTLVGAFDASQLTTPVLLTYKPILNYLVWVYFCAVLGHCYTPYLKFKGGKGISVGLGGSLSCFPLVGLSALAAFLVVAVASKKVSLGSVTAAVGIPFFAVVLLKPFGDLSFYLVLVALAVMVLWAHRVNIKNLLRGTERSFSIRK